MNKWQEIVARAYQIEKGCIVKNDEITQSKGYTAEEFELMGMPKSLLKKLVRQGFAKHGYAKNKDGSVESRYILVQARDRD